MHSLAFILLPRDDEQDARHGVDGRVWIATARWATYDTESPLPAEQRRFDYLSAGGRFMDLFLPDDYDPVADPANYRACPDCKGEGGRPFALPRALRLTAQARRAEGELDPCRRCDGSGKVADPNWLDRYPPETARMTVAAFRPWIATRDLEICAWIRRDEAWHEDWEMPGTSEAGQSAALRAIVEADLDAAAPEDWVVGLDVHMIYPDGHPVRERLARTLPPGTTAVEIAFN